MNTVISQAMATGLPVITTRHSGLPEQVEDWVNGFLVNEKDYEALADRNVYFINHPELWPDMSRRARERVTERYDSKTLMRKQLQWYLEVIRR